MALAQAVELRAGLEPLDGAHDRGPHQQQVGPGIVIEVVLDQRRHQRREVGPVAVEVAATAERIAAHVAAVEGLGEADGIGRRHDHDLAQDVASGVRRVEQAHEVVQHQHARGLVRMERGLEVGLGPRAHLTIAVGDEGTLRAGGGREKRDAGDGLDHCPRLRATAPLCQDRPFPRRSPCQ